MAPEKESRQLFLYDKKIRKDYPVAAGIDEAGRGPLAGPVVAAAVILKHGISIKRLRDSKKVPESERKKLFWAIVEGSTNIGIGVVEPGTIDQINILQATRLAMETAIRDLLKTPDILLIDAVTLPNNGIVQKSIIRGESVSASIAAASIVAKTLRDNIMLAYHKEYPHYNFREHKGYSTKKHMELLQIYGPCPIHRKSFKKVMDLELPFNLNNTTEKIT